MKIFYELNYLQVASTNNDLKVMMSHSLDEIKLFFFSSVTTRQLYRLISLMSFKVKVEQWPFVTGCDMFDEYCQSDQSSLSSGRPQIGG